MSYYNSLSLSLYDFVWCVCVDFCKWRSLRLNWREEKLLEARCAVRWSTDSKLLPRPPPPNPRFALEWFTPSDSLLLSRLITKAVIKRGPTIYHELEFRDRSLEFGEKLLWISFEYQNLAEVKWHCVYHRPNYFNLHHKVVEKGVKLFCFYFQICIWHNCAVFVLNLQSNKLNLTFIRWSCVFLSAGGDLF